MTAHSIRKIEIENFLSFKGRHVIEFGKGLNAIIGPCGSGKSNLLRALFYGYLGKSAKSLKVLENPELTGFTGELATRGSAGTPVVRCVPGKMGHCLEVFDMLGEAGGIDLTEKSRARLLDAVPGMGRSEALWHTLSESFERYTAELLAGEGDAHLKDSRGISGRLIPFGIAWNGCDDEQRLSGGERSLLNLAFVLALSECFEGPIVLDNVGAVLDKKFGERAARLLKEIAKSRQIVIVSRHDSVVEESNRIFGLSMNKEGCSAVTVLDV